MCTAGMALGAGQRTGGGPGGHDQAVVAELGPVVGRHGAGARVSSDSGPTPQPELEAQGVEHVRGVVVDAGHVPGAGQHLLGQRGAVVGGVDLVADDDHRPGVALVADLLGRPQAGQRGSDHDDGGVTGQGIAHGPSS